MPDDEIPEKLLSLVSPHIQDLKQLANQAVRIKQNKSRQTGRNYTFRKKSETVFFKNLFIAVCFPALISQPTPATKQSTLQVLDLISSLFSTLDLNTDSEGLDGVKGRRFAARSNPVKKPAHCHLYKFSAEH